MTAYDSALAKAIAAGPGPILVRVLCSECGNRELARVELRGDAFYYLAEFVDDRAGPSERAIDGYAGPYPGLDVRIHAVVNHPDVDPRLGRVDIPEGHIDVGPCRKHHKYHSIAIGTLIEKAHRAQNLERTVSARAVRATGAHR
jgi:hypothetical protein